MKKISSIKHWNTLYNKNKLTNSPTKFAKFNKENPSVLRVIAKNIA